MEMLLDIIKENDGDKLKTILADEFMVPKDRIVININVFFDPLDEHHTCIVCYYQKDENEN